MFLSSTQMSLLLGQWNGESTEMVAIWQVQNQISAPKKKYAQIYDKIQWQFARKHSRKKFKLCVQTRTNGSKSEVKRTLEDLMSLWIILLWQPLCK